jgi:hypothetical protein
LAGQLLIGYFNWIRDTQFGIVATRSLCRHIAVALPNIITRSVRRSAASLCAGHVQQFGGESPPANLMEVKA